MNRPSKLLRILVATIILVAAFGLVVRWGKVPHHHHQQAADSSAMFVKRFIVEDQHAQEPLAVSSTSSSFQQAPIRKLDLESHGCPSASRCEVNNGKQQQQQQVVMAKVEGSSPNLNNVLERLGDRHCIPDTPGQMPEGDRRFKALLPFETLCSGHLNIQQTRAAFSKMMKLQVPSAEENKPPTRPFDNTNCCASRYELLDALKSQGFRGWAMELGVATGDFSNSILNQTDFDKLISVDFWKKDVRRMPALKKLRQGANVLRSCAVWDTFENALELFKNIKFSFIFLDGFAREGEGGSKTLIDWYKHVHVGGVFAGHDYDDHFPRVKNAVHGFLKLHPELKLYTVNGTGVDWDGFGSWYVIKPE